MRNQSNPFFIIILALFSCNILSAQTTFKHKQNRFSRVQQARENREKDIPVYIFPCKMGYNNMMILKQNARNDTTLLFFWQNLKQGYDIFLRTHQELEFQVDIAGKYVFQNQINVHTYPWFNNYDKKDALINCVKVPEEYERIPAEIGSFESWLRNLPLKQGNPPIYLHNGAEKSYQGGHYAVVDIDVGAQDLQQCADAIIRFYAEFLYSKNDFDKIKFKITNGDVVTFRKWISGYRPIVSGNTVTWYMQVEPDSSYENLEKYLKFIFIYAGTYSLNQQLRKVGDINEMVIGDIFIQAGFPGHAIIVVEMAINKITGEKIFLLCQSFMPAQDIHILQNLNDPGMSPWYRLNFGDTLHTPEWTFEKQDLKRF